MINFYDGYVSKGCFPMNRTQSNMQDVIGMYVSKKVRYNYNMHVLVDPPL